MEEETIPEKTKGKRIKLILEISFFAVLMVFAVIYLLKDDPKTTFTLLSQASFFPLLIAILLLLSTLFLDGMNITLLSRLYNKKYHYYQGLINVCIGQTLGVFVKTASNILQALTFTKQDIKSHQAASILTMNTLMFQFTLFIFSLWMVLAGYPYVKDIPIQLLGNLPLSIITIIGLLIQLFFLLGIIGLGFWRGLHRFVLNTGINTLAKLHIIRNPEMVRRNKTLQFATYRVELKRLFQHRVLVLILFLSNMLKRFLLGIIPYFIFWSLKTDLSQLDFLASLYGTGYVNVVASFLSVGAPEVMFQSTFSYFLKALPNANSLASASNLLWRSITFYLLFLIGIITLLCYKGSPKRHEVLSSTKTIYDLELSNLKEADPVTLEFLNDVLYQPGKAKEAEPTLLSKEEVDKSLQAIKQSVAEGKSTVMEAPEDQLASVLKKQQEQLAQVEKEVEEELKKDKPDKEIMNQVNQDLNVEKEKDHKRKVKKELRRQKKIEKLKKKINRLQPKGNEVIEEEGDEHLIIKSKHEVIEYSNMPDSENRENP